MTAKLLKSVVLPPSGGGVPTATFIIAHGLGDSAAGWTDVAEMLSRRPNLQHVRFVLPNAPVQPVTLNGGMPMPSWFDSASYKSFAEMKREKVEPYTNAHPTVKTLDDISGGEDEVGLRKSADAISALVDEQAKGDAKIPSNRVVVGGFSQGGAIGLLSGLTHPTPVAGIVALSTWLPLRAKLVAPYLPSHASSLPILVCHGTADPVVRFEYGQRSAKFLRAGGDGGAGVGCGEYREVDGKVKGVRFEQYPGMPHSACPQEINHIGEWLEKVIPAQ